VGRLINSFTEQSLENLLKPKVYVTRGMPQRGLKRIQEAFHTEVWQEYAPPPKQVLKDKAGEADALVTLLSDRIDKEIFNAAPKLKIVAQMAVGYDNINVQEATKRGVYVTNTPEVLTETTADFAWALLMAVARRVPEADRYVRKGKWCVAWHPDMLTGRDVYGSTIGIVGAGRIGQAVAQRAKGFNMKTLYYNRSPKPDIEKLGAKRVELDELLRESDFVSVHVPLTKETTHLINAEKLVLMKGSAYLVNNSRGAVIDEKALFEALKARRIAGAALDVFEQEPIQLSNPLLGLENIVVAPHISSASIETRAKMSDIVAENLLAFFRGEKPPNLVNTETLENRPLMKLI
jgi:glyoxylate reductase